MHIPDGYLSPQTYIPLYGGFLVVAAFTLNKVKNTLDTKMIPYLGMATAFSFLIMMFNIPIPGGTSGHAVGAGIIALLLGPWLAFWAVSVALIIQALIFGDGGITAIGANCINLAFVMSFVAWWSFRLLMTINNKSDKQLLWNAFFAGWLSLNAAALLTAIQLGIQPLIAVGPDGNPLYAPYPLKVAVPAMMFEHILLFGIIEGLVTMLIFKYFLKNNKELIESLK